MRTWNDHRVASRALCCTVDEVPTTHCWLHCAVSSAEPGTARPTDAGATLQMPVTRPPRRCRASAPFRRLTPRTHRRLPSLQQAWSPSHEKAFLDGPGGEPGTGDGAAVDGGAGTGQQPVGRL